ncbi:hypothetical protein PDG61_17380 [Mycolicibacterium sp. BiH015]|uniref:hypothetical protein n=1 Tax=Mycolicibacterium sp. BiH015 TaxID=3018808 RepID=UPI0022E52A4F|nr:hypothetical protein [Mycolicibacterium sp. BiH015]MDA2892695.1 hypothetical protein [Mycolicibacterium sp. BiH015]
MMLGLEFMTGVLAQEEPRQTGPDFGKASPVGLIIIVLLLIAVFLLVWSMNKHLKRLPKSFDSDAVATADADPDLTTENPADGKKRESP